METAPFYSEVASAPAGATAFWATAVDGVRLRIGVLAGVDDLGGAEPKGTVLLMPGRTEYLEKYGPAALCLAQRGYCTISIDWRGQGLSDRPRDDTTIGHVNRFEEYQTDVAAMVHALGTLDLPKPHFLLAHSMGGAIGLRALHAGLPVQAVAFSAPMWNIQMAPILRPTAWVVTSLTRPLGLGWRITPGTAPTNYVSAADFDDNMLTKDPEMYAWMRNQVETHPELGLGGPSMTWLNEALRDMRDLRARPAPPYPCITWLGGAERIIDPRAVHALMASWPDSTLEIVPNAEHEIMMESAAIQATFFDACAAHFDASVNGQNT